MSISLNLSDMEILIDGLECLEVKLKRHKDYLLLLEEYDQSSFINDKIKHVREIKKKLTIAKERGEVDV